MRLANRSGPASATFDPRSRVSRRIEPLDLGLGVLLFAGALSLREVLISTFSFDGLYGQDPFAYLRYSVDLKRALASLEPPPPFFWPIGYPLLVALAMTVLSDGARAAQCVSTVSGSLAAPLVYALVRALRPCRRGGAIVAGLLAMTAPQLIISSMSVMSDAAGLAWISFSAWALIRHHQVIGVHGAASLQTPAAGARPALALAAFAFAMAVLTRWAYLLATFPWGLSTLLAWREARLAPRQWISCAAVALSIALLVVGSQFSADLSRGQLSHAGDLQVAGWDPVNAIRSTVTNSDGTFSYPWPIGVFYALPLVHPSFIFPLLSVFVLLGAIELGRGARSTFALFVGWPLVMYLYLAGRAWENPRFSLGLFPPLLVLLGVGFERIVGAAPSKRRSTAIVCAAIGILGSLAWSMRTVGRFVAVKDAQLEAVRWVEHATPAQATIVAFGLNNMLEYYTHRNIMSLYALDAESLGTVVSSAPFAFLLVDPENLEDQWRGKPPGLNFEWLREHATLNEVGRRSPWILFTIEPRRG